MLRAENLTLSVPPPPAGARHAPPLRRVLCRDLSLTVRPGQCWAILGKNGSGKTTLIHALGGLRAPASGRVELLGKTLEAYPRRELARRLGVLLQDEAQGFWGSVMEYVLLGRYPHSRTLFGWRPEDAELACLALQRMDLAGLGERPLTTLSGGERQRARIALLLAQSPQYCLLDEPLQHLDLQHQLETMRIFRAMASNGGAAVMMVLHDTLWASRYCDHVLLVYDSGITLAGPTEELLTRQNLEELYQCALEEIGAGRVRHFVPGGSQSV